MIRNWPGEVNALGQSLKLFTLIRLLKSVPKAKFKTNEQLPDLRFLLLPVGNPPFYLVTGGHLLGFPGGASGKEPACQSRRCKRRGFDPWVGKILWRRTWQPTRVLLPGELLVGYSPCGRKESDTTEAT